MHQLCHGLFEYLVKFEWSAVKTLLFIVGTYLYMSHVWRLQIEVFESPNLTKCNPGDSGAG